MLSKSHADMTLGLLALVNSARVFSRASSRSVSHGEPFDLQRVGTTYELTPTAESKAPGGSRFPPFYAACGVSSPLSARTRPGAGPRPGGACRRRFSPPFLSGPPPAAANELTRAI